MDGESVPVRHRQQGTVTVTRADYGDIGWSDDEVREDQIHVPLFSTEVGQVEVEGSITRNMGNFNSVRVAVKVTLPCYPEATELERVEGIASHLVEAFLGEEMEKAVNERGPVYEVAEAAPSSAAIQPTVRS